MRWVAALVLCLTGFSGCVEDASNLPDPQTSSSDQNPGTGDDDDADGPGGGDDPGMGAGNAAPVAGLNATLLGGQAPLDVTFTIIGTDDDGDLLNWTLSFGDGSVPVAGNETPASTGHVFTEAGTYEVLLTVTDGLQDANANLTIVVDAAPPPAPPTPPGPPPQDEWVVFNADGTCDAKNEVAAGPAYLHERGNPPGTGFLLGDGTWIYEESNSRAGLQVGGSAEIAAYQGCLNPDTLVF